MPPLSHPDVDALAAAAWRELEKANIHKAEVYASVSATDQEVLDERVERWERIANQLEKARHGDALVVIFDHPALIQDNPEVVGMEGDAFVIALGAKDAALHASKSLFDEHLNKHQLAHLASADYGDDVLLQVPMGALRDLKAAVDRS